MKSEKDLYVSKDILPIVKAVLAKKNISDEMWVNGTGVPVEAIDLKSDRKLIWDQVSILYERWEFLSGNEQAYQLLREEWKTLYRKHEIFAKILGRFLTQKSLFKLACGWFMQRHLPMIESKFEILDDGRFKVEFKLKDGFRPCIQMFKVIQINMGTSLLSIGLPEGNIRADLSPQGATYYFTPHYVEKFSIVRIIINFFYTDSIVKELVEQQKNLKASYEELKELNQTLEERIEERGKKIDQYRMAQFESSKYVMLGSLAAGMAHEINNPLTIIIGNAQILKRTDDLKESQNKNCDNILSSSQRIRRIIENLLFLAKEGSQEDSCNLAEVLERAIEIFSPKIDLNKIEINYTFGANQNCIIPYSKRKIGQAIMNLLENSIDAVVASDKKMIEIQVSENINQQRVEIVISDSGVEISEDLAERIFDPFFTTKTVNEGLGLGLSTAKSVIESASGAKLFYSKVTGKKAFIAYIPYL